MLYHKLIAEVSGDDGREWLVSVEPPMHVPKEGEETRWEVSITPQLTRQQMADGVSAEPIEYKIPTRDGMFSALSLALNLVP